MGGPILCGSAAVPDGSLVAGKVLDPASVGQVLRQLIARTEVKETHALVAMNDSAATFRVLYLPSAATDKEVGAAVARELPLDPERLTTRWTDIGAGGDRRIVYAVAWDRSHLNAVVETVRHAALEPSVVELKSASIARAVAAQSCIVVDLSATPFELVLVDRHLPQVWHAVDVKGPVAEDVTAALAGPLRSVIRFEKRRRDSTFGANSPVLLCGEQVIAPQQLASLGDQIGLPVQPLPPPPRIPAEVRYATYLTCIGLIMRRN